jgi:hypothetical protein
MRTHDSGVICEFHCYLAFSDFSMSNDMLSLRVRKKIVIIMKTSGATVQNFVARDLCAPGTEVSIGNLS